MIFSKTDLLDNLQQHWADLLKRLDKQAIVIEDEGRKVAVLLSYQEWQQIQTMADELWKAQAAEAACEGPLCEDDKGR